MNSFERAGWDRGNREQVTRLDLKSGAAFINKAPTVEGVSIRRLLCPGLTTGCGVVNGWGI
jgi:hypothetical protein